MAANTINTIGQGMGQDKGAGDALALFLKVFGGEALTAFTRASIVLPKTLVRTIQNGKSATFPVLGRANAKYLKAGDSLDGQREKILHTQVEVAIDGLLTSDVMIFDIDDAMNHYDVRSEYSRQLGESLAVCADKAILAEIAIGANGGENLNGLGVPTISDIKDFAAADYTDPSKQSDIGKAIIQALVAMRAGFSKNYVPATDRVVFLTPEAYSAVVAAGIPQVSQFVATQMSNPTEGTSTKVAGFEIIEVPHLTDGGAIDGHDGTTQKHVFPTTGKVKDTNVLGLVVHRTAVGTVKLKDMALERARRIEFQADQIVGKYAMGHKVLRPEAVGAITWTAKP